jgi:hypothetical protein
MLSCILIKIKVVLVRVLLNLIIKRSKEFVELGVKLVECQEKVSGR